MTQPLPFSREINSAIQEILNLASSVRPSLTQHDLARREPTSSPTLVRPRPRANIKGHSEPWSRVGRLATY